ncbi:sensor histidine kinase inhibitor, KipI family [Amphibacillus marinus]|uniref:Sensor histidine kinase inhibitor, KipI family n=1 Tax=Amphibacillus marinus TaxID=872970 RepID=A0A1H8K9K0_9BACI|nr:5-oxoprolinase subunit PxpB [Amphibacillus marinus]SEN89692.1 sensor histidine kinase inhibitor, KipI family [Amphibacillus marinus]
MKPVIYPEGDHAIHIRFKAQIDPALNARVHDLTARLRTAAIIGVQTIIPSFRTITVVYNPLLIKLAKLISQVEPLLKIDLSTSAKPKKIITIPVCYDKAFAYDLAELANYNKLSIDEVIKRHSQTNYLIYLLGFLPGFAYLGGLDPQLAMPRLDSPRVKIPAGSVGIAGHQTGIYPVESPGGWRIIGRTPIELFSMEREQPMLYEPGDYMRFIPIDKNQYHTISRAVKHNQYQCEIVWEER